MRTLHAKSLARKCLIFAFYSAFFFDSLLHAYSIKQSYERDPRDRDFFFNSSYLTDDPYWRYSFETFQEQLKQFKVPARGDALAAFLQTLPATLKNSYVIVYESRSLQDASGNFPRIVAFSPRADFVFAFNGHPKQHGYNQLEVMHFDYENASFVFHEVNFFPGKKPMISEKNPQKCLNCHQSPTRVDVNPRPNWEPYAFWPGVIGSNNGYPFMSILKSLSENLEPLKFNKEDNALLKKQSLEIIYLQNFMKTKSQNIRYKTFGNLNINLKEPYFSVKHSTALTEQFGNLNAKRVLRLIKNAPFSKKLLIPFSHVIRCRTVAADSSTLLWLQKNNPLRTVMNEKLIDFHTNERLLGFAEMVALLFEPFGIKTEDWSMDFKTEGRLAHADRFSTPSSTFSHFDRALDFEFPEQRKWGCAELAQMSRDILQSEKENHIFSQSKMRLSHPTVNTDPLKAALQNCLSCHGDFISAPYIPFDSAQDLKKYLLSPILGPKEYGSTKKDDMFFRLNDLAPGSLAMPLHRQLPIHEREALVEYLKEVTLVP
jgi:hypothetical protein